MTVVDYGIIVLLITILSAGDNYFSTLQSEGYYYFPTILSEGYYYFPLILSGTRLDVLFYSIDKYRFP